MCETFPPNQQEDCNIPRASIKVGWENRLRYFCFWWQCAKLTAYGNAAFANDWQWLLGIPICAGVSIWLTSKFHVTELTTGHPILDGVVGAAGAFVVTWFTAFVGRFSNAPVTLYHQEKSRADDLEKQLGGIQPLQIVVQDQLYETALARHYRRFRIGVKNIGSQALSRCNLSIRDIRSLPGDISLSYEFPIIIFRNFNLNPLQEQYVTFGSYTHFHGTYKKESLIIFVIENFEGPYATSSSHRPFEVHPLTGNLRFIFEANGRECRPETIQCILWIDEKARWHLDKE
jgi:hypothetical protein